MKRKISITVEEELVSRIEAELKQGLFRNKSHVVEYALMKLLKK